MASLTKEIKMNVRSALYLLAQLMGDANAIGNKSVVQRIARRIMGKYTGKMMMRRLIGRK